MFTELRLQNFKCYRDTGVIPLRRLTVLIGVNNAGKSTLFQSILLLKQTFEDRDLGEVLITAGQRVDLGGYRDIVRRSTPSSAFSINLGVQQSMVFERESSGEQAPPPLANRLELSFDFDVRANAIRISKARIMKDKRELLGVVPARTGYEMSGPPSAVRRYLRLHFAHFLPQISVEERAPKSSSLAERVVDYWVWSQANDHMWRHVFDSTNHISPVRPPIPRYNVRGEMAESSTWAAGDNLLRDLRSRQRVGLEKQRLLDSLDYWVRERLDILRALRLQPVDSRGQVVSLVGDDYGSRSVNVANMGSGLSQLLPILAGAITTSPRGTLLVEQPELHLHPAAQADLADVFVDHLGSSKTDTQFLIETHSEHLLLRIRRRIALDELDPSQVLVLVVEPARNGHKVTALEPNERGHFPAWPSGFFEAGYEESLEFAKAATGVQVTKESQKKTRK